MPGARPRRRDPHTIDDAPLGSGDIPTNDTFRLLKGQGHIITEKGLEPSVEGDVVYSPRGVWHGFNNTSNDDVVLVWGWMGAGSIEVQQGAVWCGSALADEIPVEACQELDCLARDESQRRLRGVRGYPAPLKGLVGLGCEHGSACPFVEFGEILLGGCRSDERRSCDAVHGFAQAARILEVAWGCRPGDGEAGGFEPAVNVCGHAQTFGRLPVTVGARAEEVESSVTRDEAKLELRRCGCGFHLVDLARHRSYCTNR